MAKRLHRKDPTEPLPSRPLLAWQYDCPCGIRAYSFDGVPEIRDSAGHEIRRGARVIYYAGKFHNPCPKCGRHPDAHGSGGREDQMFLIAACPSGG